MNWRRAAKLAGRVVGAIAVAVAGLIAFPEPLFAYSASRGHVEVLSDHPIDAPGARAVMADVEARLARSPLPIVAGKYKMVVTNEDWRRRILFSPVYGVGGVAYYPLSRNHVYLSGADFARDRLLRANGTAVDPPRTLGYYGAHEIAHLLTGERAGAVRFHMLPTWVVEGLADYCALGSPGDLRAFDRLLGSAPIVLEQMNLYGVYPRYRMLVTYFLEERKWTLDQLLATNLSEADALAMLRAP